jgi:Metallo-beta-lactamase superfamily
MTFKLEAVKAEKGDALLLHYGKADKPALALVDGGPPGVYAEFLEPRLSELRKDLVADGEPLPLELVMVSHIDSDHIAGVLSLLKAIEKARDARAEEPYEIGRLWHNGFKKLAEASDGSAAAIKASLSGERPKGEAVLASVGQGEDTSAVATKLGIPRNEETKLGPLVLAGESRKLPGGLELTVLGPSPQRVEDLRQKWAKEVEAKPEQLVPAALKETVYNLSSMIVLAEHGGKRILLTGDGVGEDILAGLDQEGLLDDGGRAHFDVLKMPHHGSDRNIKDPDDFIEKVTADHYVISGNGEHGNPEPETLRMIAAARDGDAYDLWLTYRKGPEGLTKNVVDFLEELEQANPKATVHFPAEDELSITIELD